MKRQFLKGASALLLCAMLLGVAAGQETSAAGTSTTGTSTWVFFGDNHRLQYHQDANGNRIMDFSFAGYQGGGVAFPSVPVQATVSPSGGDDTSAIQSAIDTVSALPVDANGFRGTVQLDLGTFSVSSTLNIGASGVILHGSGSGDGGTVINMTGDPFLLLNIGGTGSWQTFGSSAAITDSYVPSGTTSFNVNNASGFNVGDTVLIRRPVTTAWVHLMGMDTLVRDGKPQTWISAGSTISTDRVIAAINGNQITFDSVIVKHTAPHSGDGPADFGFSGTQLFLNKCSVLGLNSNVWPAVAQSRFAGPDVLLNFHADDRGFAPHQRWATGLLCDD